jgi:GxxExxY protein
MELNANGLNAEAQKSFQVFYFDEPVGYYRIDVLVADKAIVELKAVPEILPLHQAQVISYLKGMDKPVGILANFGAASLEHQTFPNLLDRKNPLEDRFDYDRINHPEKERIKELLFMANRILITLGAGYFHQIYRRAFFYELKNAGVDFGIIKTMKAKYKGKVLGEKPVNFFILGDLLLSAVAVKELNQLVLSKFTSYISHLNCKRGLIFNFNSVVLDFRYFSENYRDCFTTD